MTNILDLDWRSFVAFDCIRWVARTLDGVHTFGSNSLRTYAVVRCPVLLPALVLMMVVAVRRRPFAVAVVRTTMVVVAAVVSLTF